MLDRVCEELIYEIFTRLPPKSLLRFRSLSKSWYSCISRPHFIRMHTSQSPQKGLIKHIIFNEEKYEFEGFYTLHLQDQLSLCPRRGYFGITPIEFSYNKYLEIVGSCDGILCLLDCKENHISLWNPLIRRKLDVPDYPLRRSHELIRLGMGFGFDAITNDYKLVSLFNLVYGGIVESFVYSMKTGVWCVIALPTPLFSLADSQSCFVKGTLHWVVYNEFNESQDVGRFYILTFDLSTHVFGKIKLPETSWKMTRLTTIQGSLVVISTKDDNGWIWVRRDASWTRAFELRANLREVFHPISNGDLLFYITWCWDRFQVYNPKTGAQSRLVNFNGARMYKTENCVESLQLLDMGLHL